MDNFVSLKKKNQKEVGGPGEGVVRKLSFDAYFIFNTGVY